MKQLFLKILLGFAITIFSVCPALSQQNEFLVGYWPFEEGGGDTVKDRSGKGNDGKINGDVKWINGKFGKALEFAPGANVAIPDSATLRDMDEYTIALWIRFNSFSSDWNHFLEKDGSYGLTVNSGTGDFRYTPNSGKVWLESRFKVEKDTWYYVTMVASDSTITFYVDGEKQSESKEPIVFNNNIINIGHGPSYPFDGVIDEVKFWAKALTEDEIDTAMKGITAVKPSKEKFATAWAYVKSQ